jgi:hypothetical protein
MKRCFTISIIISSALLASIPASAQWPFYYRPGTPLLPDGTVDMDAPAPRTADGKIDFTGTWDVIRYHQSGEQGRPIGEPAEPPPGVPPYATFWDQGFGFENGLPYQPWAREERARRMANNGIDNPDSYCLPLGHMQFHTHGQPRDIVQGEDRLAIIYEASAGVRQIFMDGRPLPDDDALEWWYGFRGDGWLDFNGSPTTEQLRTIERFSRPTYGKLEIDVTIDDPGAYTEPFTIRVDQSIMAGDNLIEWVCENEQSTQYFN